MKNNDADIYKIMTTTITVMCPYMSRLHYNMGGTKGENYYLGSTCQLKDTNVTYYSLI